jgi:hypothetical protein
MEQKTRAVKVYKMVQLEGMNIAEKILDFRGYFLGWGRDFEMSDTGFPGEFTVGLVERNDGMVVGAHYSMIQFVDQD